MSEITEMTVDQIAERFDLSTLGPEMPAVAANRDDLGFFIRIQYRKASRTDEELTFEYFRTDESGVVVESPAGNAKEFNGRVRFTDIGAVALRLHREKWAAPWD